MNLTKQSLQAVTFDAAGTLIHLAESVGDSYSRVAAEFDIRVAPDALNSAFGAVWKRTPAPFTNQQGLIDEPTLSPREKDWWRGLVRDVFIEVGTTDFSRFDDYFEQLYVHFESPGCWLLDEEAETVLDHLAERDFKLGLLSNFDYRLRRILTDLGVFSRFDAVVLSGEIEASKPDPRMFHTMSAALECAPADILHVGDDVECDIRGAENAGFHALRVKSPDQPLRKLLDLVP